MSPDFNVQEIIERPKHRFRLFLLKGKIKMGAVKAAFDPGNQGGAFPQAFE